METPQFRRICFCPSPDLTPQRRIGQNSPACHDTVHVRLHLCKTIIILSSKNISVIAYRIPALCPGFRKHSYIRSIFIEILLYPRMNDQLLQWIFIIYLQEMMKLFRRFHPQSCLDRDADLAFFKHLVQKSVQPVGLRKETGSSPLCHNGLGRTSQIKIDFFISILTEFICRPYKVLGSVRKNLRNRIHSFIVFRQYILLLSGTEVPHLIRPDKRHEIFVKSSETFMDGAAEDPARNSLKRG